VTENLPEGASQSANPDRYKLLVVVLTVVTTVLTALVSGLQADVNIRASTSNNDSQVNAILAAGELHRLGLQSAYDTSVLAGFLKDSQEATVLQITALQQQTGDPQSSHASQQRAAVAQARADTARLFSIFFTDSRYAPKSAQGLPDMQSYLADTYAAANDLVARQNAAADDYNRWNRKGDSYTSVLAILAVAFFLFGLAQALTPRLRLLFAIFGLVVMGAAGFWTVLILLG
jgi:type II secretory pathway pseudopilin PulG